MKAHRQVWPVSRMCKVLQVSKSGYYAWSKRAKSKQKMANEELLKKIEKAFEASYQTYGSPRIYHEIKDQISCSENRVARLMKQNDITAVQKKRFKRTTKANPKHPVAPNRMAGDFSAKEPNRKWVLDITYILTKEGWLYLAVALDLFSRKIVGWAMSERMTTQLVINALEMAIQLRKPGVELLHHSDRGSQYTAAEYRKLLEKHVIRTSMSAAGNCYDNAPAESFFGRLKTERIHRIDYQTRAQARSDIFAYIEGFYNRRRIQKALGFNSPEKFELLWENNKNLPLFNRPS